MSLTKPRYVASRLRRYRILDRVPSQDSQLLCRTQSNCSDMAREVQFLIKSHTKKLNLGSSGDGGPSKGYLRVSPERSVVEDVEELKLGWLKAYPPLFTPPLQAVKACVHVLNGGGYSCRRAENRIHCGVVCIGAHSCSGR